MKYDPAQLLRLLLERHLEVLLPEKPRIAQPRREHPPVAFDDRLAAVAGGDVGGAQEGRRQRAILAHAGEIFLVRAHGQHDHFARHVEIIGIEAAEQRHRPFGQPGIFNHQSLVLDQAQLRRRRRRARAVADQRLAFLMVDDDVAGAQLLGIVERPADGDRPGLVEPVAERRRAARHAVDRHRHDLLAEDGDDRVQRPHPA